MTINRDSMKHKKWEFLNASETNTKLYILVRYRSQILQINSVFEYFELLMFGKK